MEPQFVCLFFPLVFLWELCAGRLRAENRRNVREESRASKSKPAIRLDLSTRETYVENERHLSVVSVNVELGSVSHLPAVSRAVGSAPVRQRH